MLPAEVVNNTCGPLSLPLLREKEQKERKQQPRRQGRFEHEISLTNRAEKKQ